MKLSNGTLMKGLRVSSLLRGGLEACAFSLVLAAPIQHGKDQGNSPGRVFSASPLFRDATTAIDVRVTDLFGTVDPTAGSAAWYNISRISPGPNGGVLVVDVGGPSVELLLPSRGVVAEYVAGKGAGPGEFGSVDAAAWSGGNEVLISDRVNSRISIHSVSGKYVQSIRVGKMLSLIIPGKSGSAWVRPWMDPQIDRLMLISLAETGQWRILSEIGGRFDSEPWIGQLRVDPAVHKTETGFILAPPYPYEILEYTDAGKFLRSFGRKAEWLTAPEEEFHERIGRYWRLKGGRLVAIGRFRSGETAVLLVQHQPQSDSSRYLLDFFDPSGRWLTTYELSLILQESMEPYAMAVTADDALWLAGVAEHPRVIRCEIKFLR